MRTLILVGLLALTVGCAKAPPTLSPAGTQAWNQHQIQKDLDLIRDIAVEANAQTPPVIATADTRAIVNWHTAAIKIVNASGAGWQTAVNTSLDETLKALPQATRDLLAPYVQLAKTVLNAAVTR